MRREYHAVCVGETGSRGHVTKWSPTGDLLWQKRLSGGNGDRLIDVTTGITGTVYVAGHQSIQKVSGYSGDHAFLLGISSEPVVGTLPELNSLAW